MICNYLWDLFNNFLAFEVLSLKKLVLIKYYPWKKISIPKNILYAGIKFSKLVTNIDIYISIILFSGINKYNLKQTHQVR